MLLRKAGGMLIPVYQPTIQITDELLQNCTSIAYVVKKFTIFCGLG